MKELTLKASEEEIVSLVHRGIEEFEEGQVQAGVSLFLEAQYLLGEIVQNQLEQLHATPPLIPLAEDCTGDEPCHLTNAE